MSDRILHGNIGDFPRGLFSVNIVNKQTNIIEQYIIVYYNNEESINNLMGICPAYIGNFNRCIGRPCLPTVNPVHKRKVQASAIY